jgi:hypothetical protein
VKQKNKNKNNDDNNKIKNNNNLCLGSAQEDIWRKKRKTLGSLNLGFR